MSGAVSPMQTPSKARRSCQSEYETAGEEDDSDTSMYYSMIDMDRTLENKENSLNISSKSAKRLTKGGSGCTPLLRKTLQKNLVEVQTPRQKANKQVSFDVASNDSEIDHNREKAAVTAFRPEATSETNTKNEHDNDDNMSGMANDVCDVTVVETGAAETIESVENKVKSVSFLNAPIKLIVSDFDEPNKNPIIIAQSKMMENKRHSVIVTKKTNKTANANASVRNRRQQLAVETKKAPIKNGRISVYKRSSMYQPRKSSGRRSIEAMIVAKANKTLLETEAAFTDDSSAISVPVEMTEPTIENSSAAVEEQFVSVSPSIKEQTPIVTSTSIQNTKTNNERKEMVKNVAVTELNQPQRMTAPSYDTQAAPSVINVIKQSRITVAPARKSVAPFRKSVAAVRKSFAPRLSIFSTAACSSATARAQRRQTKSYLNSAKSDGTTTKGETTITKTSLPRPMPPTNSNASTSTSTSSASKSGEFVRPADVRRTIIGSSDVGARFKCLQCKKPFNTEFQLRVHTNNFHNLAKKPPSSSGSSSNASNALKCRFCDKQFDKIFALNKHMQENCTKIQPAERKRMFAEPKDRNKSDGTGNKQNSIAKASAKSSNSLANSARFTRLLTDLISESQSNGDGRHNNTSTVDETRLRLSKMSLGHSGVYRTPTKSIKCKICNAVFMSCVLFAEHSLMHAH